MKCSKFRSDCLVDRDVEVTAPHQETFDHPSGELGQASILPRPVPFQVILMRVINQLGVILPGQPVGYRQCVQIVSVIDIGRPIGQRMESSPVIVEKAKLAMEAHGYGIGAVIKSFSSRCMEVSPVPLQPVATPGPASCPELLQTVGDQSYRS